MKSFQTEHINNLPDYYKKDKNSNNYKILEIERFAVEDLRKSLSEIDNILDINNATGKTLDMYGERVGQPRGIATDDQYILLIKSKIMQNLSNGTYKSVVDSICFTLGCEPSEVSIIESDDPCVIQMVSIPINVIVSAGFTASQVSDIVYRLIPVGIRLETLLYEGTFEFSNSEDEYDETAGFCDVEGGTIGGYLGIIGSDENAEIITNKNTPVDFTLVNAYVVSSKIYRESTTAGQHKGALVTTIPNRDYKFTISSPNNRFIVFGKNGTACKELGRVLTDEATKSDTDTLTVNSGDYTEIFVFFWYGADAPDNPTFSAELVNN